MTKGALNHRGVASRLGSPDQRSRLDGSLDALSFNKGAKMLQTNKTANQDKSKDAGPLFANGKNRKAINWGAPESALKALTVLGRSEARLVRVTSDLAAEWLKLNTENRRIRGRVVDTYARDFDAGRWIPNPSDPIMISSTGTLLNGQHRLSAIVKTGKAADLYVEFGADPRSVSAIDRGLSRSAGDAFSMNTGKHKTTYWFGMARMMRQGACGTYPTLTTQEMEKFFLDHEKAIDYADSLTCNARKGIKRAPVGAALARASYHVDRDKLEEFAQVLVSGVAPLKSHAIIVTLRDWLVSHPAHGGGAAPIGVYRKTTRALLAFVNGERIKTLYEISEEPFPLPDEAKGKSRAKRGR